MSWLTQITTGKNLVILVVLLLATLYCSVLLTDGNWRLLSVKMEVLPKFLEEVHADYGGQWPFLPEQFMLDQKLIKHVGANVLIEPSTLEYTLSRPKVQDPCPGGKISKEIYPQFFKGIKDGVFFEAGALDGETHSTTLFLERELGWRGLIVEMTPMNRQLILDKHRKAYFAPVCLSPVPWPIQREMKMIYNPNKILTRWGATVSNKALKRLENKTISNKEETYVATVDCYPLHSLLLAAGFAKIDFMSLDLEGVELQVLKTLQWDLLDIKVLYMDLLHTEEGFAATRDFLISKGYEHIRGKREPVIFAKKGWNKTAA